MKKIYSKFCSFFKDGTFKKIDVIVFMVLAIFLFINFVYWDIFATTSHTVNFIEVISQGNFMDFYKINYGLVVNGVASTVCYELPVYFILMIWNLPLWVCQHFFSVDICNNFFCILWMKGIIALFLVCSCKIIKNICEEIKIDKRHIKWVVLFFASSPLLLSSTLILSQIDIIPITFMLLGFLAYIKKDYKKFIIWFSIAIPMKVISIFVFFPLLLLKEKNIFKVIKNSILVLLPFILFKFIAMLMPDYALSTSSFNDTMLSKLFNSSLIGINLGNASIFAAVYVGICIFCFMKNLKDDNEIHKYSVYISCVTYMTFLLLVSHHPYWAIYLVPFMSLLVFQNINNNKINILIEMAFNFVMLFIHTYYYSWCFGTEQVRRMFIPQLIGDRIVGTFKFANISSIYMYFGLDKFYSAILGICLALTIAFIIINYPSNKNEEIKVERAMIWLRMFIIIPFAVLMILCYVL